MNEIKTEFFHLWKNLCDLILSQPREKSGQKLASRKHRLALHPQSQHTHIKRHTRRDKGTDVALWPSTTYKEVSITSSHPPHKAVLTAHC